jgi:cytoskeletal protein RodZ
MIDELTFGQILTQKRQEKNIEISEIVFALRVKSSDIKAIESDNYLGISKNIYIPGLIRSYAKLLGIDQRSIESHIRSLRLKSNVENKEHKLVNLDEGDDLKPDANFIFNASILGAVMILVFLLFYNRVETNSDEIASSDLVNQLNKIVVNVGE